MVLPLSTTMSGLAEVTTNSAGMVPGGLLHALQPGKSYITEDSYLDYTLKFCTPYVAINKDLLFSLSYCKQFCE